jgi:hypothetical protein
MRVALQGGNNTGCISAARASAEPRSITAALLYTIGP